MDPLPNLKSDPLDLVFMALADASRRKIVHLLTSGEMPVSDIAAEFDVSLQAVSKHIKMLEKAKIVQRKVEGRTHYLSLVPEQLAGALDWISIYRNFWQNRMNTLANLIETPEE
ncbi:ArsR family transcriptional regulator [Marinomonas sp. SBI22]|nr:ArsR family transcriptional regulator [Marinomonas sp. SBI22]KZM44042.1 ArsR family transcriptional regulator [Marinomonas sp. SBI8L]